MKVTRLPDADPRPRRVAVGTFDGVHRGHREVIDRSADRAEFEIECSSGTYVRSLIADLGDAYCERLRRTRIGPFTVDDADEDRPLALADALGRLPGRVPPR